MNIPLLLSLMLLLSACSGTYQFNSNLDAATISDYFKASEVTVYEGNVTPASYYEVLGFIEAEDCQEYANDAPASISQARTLARRSAADKGANGLIIKKCMVLAQADQACFSRAICVGQAIKIPVTEQAK